MRACADRGLDRARRRRDQQPRRRRRAGLRRASTASPPRSSTTAPSRRARPSTPRWRSAIDAHAPDVVALAGFMRILGAAFVRRFDGRLVNIHPSLLPAFPGCTRTGARSRPAARWPARRVHFVTAELDHGPIIGAGGRAGAGRTTARQRSRRACSREEHVLYPRAVRWLVEELLRARDGVVTPPRRRVAVAASRRPPAAQNRLAAMLIVNARIVVLKTNDSTDCSSTRRRIGAS